MLGKLYARWMYRWETDLTTRDTNRIVRPVEWGFDWLEEFARSQGFPYSAPEDDAEARADDAPLERLYPAPSGGVFRL